MKSKSRQASLNLELIQWKKNKEKYEARRNFGKYIRTRIEKIIDDPGYYQKLKIKIDKIQKKKKDELKENTKIRFQI